MYCRARDHCSVLPPSITKSAIESFSQSFCSQQDTHLLLIPSFSRAKQKAKMSQPSKVLATSPGVGGDQKGGVKKNSYARVLGSAAAGVSELMLFHPVDTVAKRLMSNQSSSIKGQRPAEAMAALNKV